MIEIDHGVLGIGITLFLVGGPFALLWLVNIRNSPIKLFLNWIDAFAHWSTEIFTNTLSSVP